MFDLLWVKYLCYVKEKKRDRKVWSKYVKKKNCNENLILKGDIIFVRCCFIIILFMYILDL